MTDMPTFGPENAFPPSSFGGLSGSDLLGLAGPQSPYDPTPSLASQRQAMEYVEEAGRTNNPALRQELLDKAIAELQSGGAPPGDPPMDPVAMNPGGPDQPVTTADTTPDDGNSGLSVSGNSVNTGEYTITASTNDDGSLTITNNETHQSVEVWGDPHIKVNGQDTADFQNDDLNIQLQDGTVIHIQPTATNSDGKAHIAEVSITKGDQAVTMSGDGSSGFVGGVNTSGVTDDAAYQSALYNSPTATDITLGADGELYYNNANGSMGAEITPEANGGETDLDGARGGLIGEPTTTAFYGAGSSSGLQQTILQLQGMLRNESSFYSVMMMQNLSEMLSQSTRQSGTETA